MTKKNGWLAAVCVVVGAGATILAGGELRAQGAQRTVWDGVYSEAQAARGANTYNMECAACHGATLEGTGEAPSLSGAQFKSNWNGLSVGDLFDRIRTTMPLGRPSALSRDAYAEALAHILKFNGYPAGPNDMPNRGEMLAAIGITDQQLATAAPASAPAASGAAGSVASGPNDYPNPYRTDTGFFRMPPGRAMGSSSAVATDSRGHVWIAERCGANSCAGSDLDPIMEFDATGKFIRSFGAGMFNFPHGFHIDAADNIWLTDGRAANGRGATVTKFSPAGEVLLVLGKPGVSAEGGDSFASPNAVLVAPDGSVFVADGHSPDEVARILKFDARGRFIRQWGEVGSGPGQLNVPHALAMDSQGRLFVADRWNNRIQIYDQEGQLLDSWTQFGRPSGLYIDGNDILYAADSESRSAEGYGHNPGWRRGIRIGSAKDGSVSAFIPDTEPNPEERVTSGAEGIWAAADGAVYGAQVLQKAVVRYTR